MARRHHYHVYVVALSSDVLYESRFRKSNPDYIPGKPCVYVGMTGLDPDIRFDKHKAERGCYELVEGARSIGKGCSTRRGALHRVVPCASAATL